MRSLHYLQEGVLAEDKSIVADYLGELDLKTANEEMVKAGEKFGFKTVKVYDKVYGSLTEISRKLGYVDPSSFGRLLKKWEIYAPGMGGFGSEYRRLVREKLGLNENDGSSLLVDWTGFLIGGVKGEGEHADEVLAYLLKREREARIAGATIDQYKAEILQIKKCKEIVAMAHKIDQMQDGHFRDSAIKTYEKLTGESFPKSGQRKLWD